MTREQYIDTYTRIMAVLVPECATGDVMSTIEFDWNRETGGRVRMPFKQFHDSLFELADLWCEGIDTKEYVEFLDELLVDCFPHHASAAASSGKAAFRRFRMRCCQSVCRLQHFAVHHFVLAVSCQNQPPTIPPLTATVLGMRVAKWTPTTAEVATMMTTAAGLELVVTLKAHVRGE